MIDDNPPSETEEEKKLRLKMLRYHEAAHAVLMWNLGIEVERVTTNRSRGSGLVMPALERPKRYDVTRRLSHILAALAGGVAHRCFQSGDEKSAVRCSSGDLKIALDLIVTLDDLPPGAELYLYKALLNRTIQLIDTSEVQSQIYETAGALQSHGCLLRRQVHVLLKSLPVSRIATRHCRQVVAEIEAELPMLVQRAMEVAPRLAAHPDYAELSATYPTMSRQSSQNA